ncbi:site-specific DNA-methyltransferase, partial [bacterium]|nr:site-specific DNA-methyltransferase [bacterium]
VRNSNYVITLDRIFKQKGGIEIIEKILKHKNFKEQVKEWKELGILEKEPKDLIENTLTGKQLKKEYEFLPIDTKYFKDLELEILNLFDNLDQSLDGWLIKSENWQALNTIFPKFKEKIQTIYIDPPFNKEQEADYFYSVKFKDATWITMLENRLRLARDLLKDTGSIFVRCDYNGNMYVRLLMNEIFGEENFRNEIVVNRIVKKGFGADRFPTAIDSLFYFVKSEKFIFKGYRKFLDKPKEPWWHDMTSMTAGRRGGEPRIIFGKKLFPPPGRAWTFSQDRINEMEKEGKIRIRCSICGYTHYKGKWTKCPKCGEEKERVDYLVITDGREPIDNDWTDIPGYSFSWNFQTENAEILLKRVIESTSNEGDLVLDFFLGSGTTTAVAHKLGRKWLGVEMGEHFYSVVLPRMKKVLAYDKSGISKEKDVKEKYNQQKAGGFFKYYELEQYEDTLRKTKYEDSDLFEIPNQSPYSQYVFMKDKKMLDALEIDYKNNKVKVDLSKLYPDIDIAETLSNLQGKHIKKISKDEAEFEDGERVDIKNLDYRLIKPLIWW